MCRERERLDADMYNSVRKASEVHREVRKYVKKIAVPGVRLFDMCETLENSVRALIQEKGLQVRRARRAAPGGTLCTPSGLWSPSSLLRLSRKSGFTHGRITGGLPYHIESLACLARG